MGQSIDFKKWKVVASCLHINILATEVILLQKMKLPTKYIQQSLYPDVLRGNYDTERQ